MTTPLRLPYDLDDATYDLYRDLVLERTGIHFGPRRRGELARGVRRLQRPPPAATSPGTSTASEPPTPAPSCGTT